MLYRLPQLAGAVEAGAPIWIVEGEADVHAMERANAVATTNVEGAAEEGGRTELRPEYAVMLAGADVIVVADYDAAGRAHARAWAALLAGAAASVPLLLPAEGAKDARDHLVARRTLEDFRPPRGTDPGG